MFEKRLRGYRAIGYAKGEAPLGYEEPKDEQLAKAPCGPIGMESPDRATRES